MKGNRGKLMPLQCEQHKEQKPWTMDSGLIQGRKKETFEMEGLQCDMLMKKGHGSW